MYGGQTLFACDFRPLTTTNPFREVTPLTGIERRIA